jgi:transposase InsO family protein
MVNRLKTVCPTMGKVKLAQTLARAGLHLGATTIGRMLKEERGELVQAPPPKNGEPPENVPGSTDEAKGDTPIVTAKYPNNIWHVDLTVMPTAMGFCCSWLPLALPQRWPFCYWLAVAVDHFSRRAMGCTAMKENPTSQAVRAFLGRAIAKAKATPKYIICDRGQQFDCQGFRDWCRRKGIQPPRYGAVGKHGSIAVVERFILTLKGLLCGLLLIPYRREAFQRELDSVIEWYNGHRPHTRLRGRTPNEVYRGEFPANPKPRFEPRSRWPRGSPCSGPWALVKGKPGARLELQVKFLHGRRHLPLVSLARAA